MFSGPFWSWCKLTQISSSLRNKQGRRPSDYAASQKMQVLFAKPSLNQPPQPVTMKIRSPHVSRTDFLSALCVMRPPPPDCSSLCIPLPLSLLSLPLSSPSLSPLPPSLLSPSHKASPQLNGRGPIRVTMVTSSLTGAEKELVRKTAVLLRAELADNVSQQSMEHCSRWVAGWRAKH